MDSKNFPTYFYKKEGPLAVPLSWKDANYEDKILIDEIKRNMDNMVSDAESKGVTVKTEFFSPKDQKKENKRYEKLHSTLAPTGPYYSNKYYKEVNVPRTPNLENYLIMAEEMEHQFNRKDYPKKENRLDIVTDRYEEEKRAKSAALDRVGGYLTPEVRGLARATMDTYKDRVKRDAESEEKAIKKGDSIRKRGPLSDFFLKNFWDSSRRDDQIIASKYWEGETKPTQAIKELYPELK